MAGCGIIGAKKVFDLDLVCFWKSPARRKHRYVATYGSRRVKEDQSIRESGK
jgi:hypothetical protein